MHPTLTLNYLQYISNPTSHCISSFSHREHLHASSAAAWTSSFSTSPPTSILIIQASFLLTACITKYLPSMAPGLLRALHVIKCLLDDKLGALLHVCTFAYLHTCDSSLARDSLSRSLVPCGDLTASATRSGDSQCVYKASRAAESKSVEYANCAVVPKYASLNKLVSQSRIHSEYGLAPRTCALQQLPCPSINWSMTAVARENRRIDNPTPLALFISSSVALEPLVCYHWAILWLDVSTPHDVAAATMRVTDLDLGDKLANISTDDHLFMQLAVSLRIEEKFRGPSRFSRTYPGLKHACQPIRTSRRCCGHLRHLSSSLQWGAGIDRLS
jgi:hypothetical protein